MKRTSTAKDLVGQSDTLHKKTLRPNFLGRLFRTALKKRNISPSKTLSKKKHNISSFTTLPLEIQLQIYEYLLTTSATINKPGTLVESKNRFARGFTDRPGLEIAVLSTCHQVYDEALPVMYGQNTFSFYNLKDVEAFRSNGLVTAKTTNPTNTFDIDVPLFGFRSNPQGRLALLKMINIHFLDDYFGGRDIMRHWEPFFEPSRSLRYETRFPAVEKLCLNFMALELGMEGLEPSPIVRKFKVDQGLRGLEVVGVQHIATLDRLRKGLVREGGEFIVSEEKDKKVVVESG
ncbi:MAG: hypothetical protein Q9213_003755 [Squamulea squamosa]